MYDWIQRYGNDRAINGIALLVTLTTLATAGCNSTGHKTEYDKTAPTAAMADIERPPIEIVEEKYPDGVVKMVSEGYRDDDGNLIGHGAIRLFWEQGEKKAELHFIDGIRHGPRTAWYRNGQVKTEGQFHEGLENGIWKVWYPDGSLAEEQSYDRGAWNGLFTAWYMNGEKKTEVRYVKGKKQGLFTRWNESGTVVERIEYVDNVAQP